MAAEESLLSIIPRLLERTQNGHLKWSIAKSGSGNFTCLVEKYVFVLSRVESPIFTQLVLSMFDDNTDLVVTGQAKKTKAGRVDSDYPLFLQLYDGARRSALDVDAKVNEVKKILDKL